MTTDPEAQLRASWVANAAAWTEVVRDRAIESRRVATDDAVVEAVAALHPDRVLDVGCGEGWLARALLRRGAAAEVVGIDGSAPLIDAALAAGEGRFRVLSYAALTADPAAAGGPYDAAVCNFSLLGADHGPLLSALRGVLRPGGVLVIQTVHPWGAIGDGPYRSGWRVESFATFGGTFAEPMPWYYRTLQDWLALIAGAGYRLSALREPLHPEHAHPLSLLIEAVTEG